MPSCGRSACGRSTRTSSRGVAGWNHPARFIKRASKRADARSITKYILGLRGGKQGAGGRGDAGVLLSGDKCRGVGLAVTSLRNDCAEYDYDDQDGEEQERDYVSECAENHGGGADAQIDCPAHADCGTRVVQRNVCTAGARAAEMIVTHYEEWMRIFFQYSQDRQNLSTFNFSERKRT